MKIKICNKCKCGCGKITNYGKTWIRGHHTTISLIGNMHAKGQKRSKESRLKMSIAKQNMSEETKKKMSIAKQNMSEETKRKIGLAHKGKIIPEEIKKAQSKRMSGEKHPMFGKKHSKETKQKMSKSQIGNINAKGGKGKIVSEETRRKLSLAKQNMSKEIRKNMSLAQIGKKLSKETKAKMGFASLERWKDPIFQKKQYKARAIKPNKPEITLLKLLNKLFLNEYKYVGDYQFFLGGKNPDFMNVNGQKKLIELFGDYWHKGDNPQDRIDHFKQYGFNTLVIWEHELKNRLSLKKKLAEFHDNIKDQ